MEIPGMPELELLEQASRRFQESQDTREIRLEHLDKITRGEGGDWRKIDSPLRVERRLRALGRTDLIASMMDESEPDTEADGPSRPLAEALERILGTEDFLEPTFLMVGAAVARSVGRVIDSASGRGFGTGFMVSERLLLTNNHVLPLAQSASRSAIQFDFYVQSDGNPARAESFSLRPDEFFETDRDLDFSLVAVAREGAAGTAIESRGWNPLIVESGKTIVGEPVNIIQHPQGGPQKVALRQNNILDVPGDFLHYKADTEPGSSGSPVFNDQWELSALHHAGVPEKRDGVILLTTGQPWDGSRATASQISWVANEGIRISRIVAFLKALAPRLSRSKRRLFEAVFAPRPSLEKSIESDQRERRADGRATPVVGENGTIEWVFPLRLRVDLGGTSPAAGDGPTDRADTTSRPSAQTIDHSSTVNAAELDDALQEIEQHEDDRYYDEESDQEELNAYYSDMPEQAHPEEWFAYFSAKVRQTHTKQLRYRTARRQHLYPWIDLRETDSGRELFSIYSAMAFSPEEAIREDFEIERLRRERLQEIMRSEAATSPEALQEHLDALEAALPYNCEHVVPQSWFGKSEPMRGDLHHLFTCESGCNSFRSNVPYYQWAPEEEKVRERCGRREIGKFEPGAGKGAVARSTLYFLLRYPGMIGDAVRELQLERLETLLEWSEQEPPDTYEFHRNRAIAQVQGNRNPMIDFAPMAPDVEFTRGFGA